MHLALNAYFWNWPNSGSGQYTRQLVRHLNQLVSDLQITLIYPQVHGDDSIEDIPPGISVRPVPTRSGQLGKVIFEQITFPRTCQSIGADIAHVPYWGSPIYSQKPVVVTVHDLTTYLVREYRRDLRARMYNAMVSAGARAADHVITDSLASKRDIGTHLSIDSNDISSIYLAAGSQFNPKDDFLMDMAVLQKYNLPHSYVLYMGGYEIHKNVTNLLLAYTYVAQALGEDYPLVLAGVRPPRASRNYPDYDGYIEQLGLQKHIQWISFVEEADKPAIYRGASCFAFISRHEGFGLPPLEAMACGIPVVSSNSASLPEVVGDAAFTIDPDDTKQIGGSIIATILQQDLAQEMKEKGLAQSESFSWGTTATETLLVYDQVLRKSQ